MGHQVPSQAEFDALKKQVSGLEVRVAALETPVTPVPVDCVLTDWSIWLPVAGPTGQWSACENGTQSRVEERRRTVAVSPANGGAPCDPLQYDTRIVTQPCVVVPPSPNMLQPSDFTYQGAVRAPGHVIGTGALAGKNENGQITLFMVSRNDGGELFEMSYNGQASITAPPVLTATKNSWPTWNDNTRLDISYEYPSGTVRKGGPVDSGGNGNPWPLLGLAYHAGLLFVSYLDYYNTNYGATDHCLVVCDLTKSGHNRSKGPYRFSGVGSVKRIGGCLFPTPHGLGMGGSMMCISRNMDNTWGPSVSILPWDAIGSNPGGFNSAHLPVQERLMHSVQDRASRANDFLPNTSDPFNPDRPGFWCQRDRMNGIAWIETTSGKRGVVTMGGMAIGQVWYGTWEGGPNGVVNPCRSADRGENAEGFRPEWRIYDPHKLTGGVVQPDHIFNPRDRSPHCNFDACERYYTGVYFDQLTSTLFAASFGEIQVWKVV